MVILSDLLIPLIYFNVDYYSKLKKSNNNTNSTNTTNITDIIETYLPYQQNNISNLFSDINITNITNITITNITNITNSTSTSNNKGTQNIGIIIIALVILIPFLIFNSSYTIIVIFSTTRRRYILGDYLSGKKSNDKISLMKTMKLICGYAFSLVYCNLYFWKTIDYKGTIFASPIFYEKIKIPDHNIIYGISVYMVAKIIIIIFFSISNLKFESVFGFLKNDLAEFNKNFYNRNFNDLKYEENFKKLLESKLEINDFLLNNI